MVGSGMGFPRPGALYATVFKAEEGDRRCDLVEIVAVYIEHVSPTVEVADNVRIPYFVEKCFSQRHYCGFCFFVNIRVCSVGNFAQREAVPVPGLPPGAVTAKLRKFI